MFQSDQPQIDVLHFAIHASPSRHQAQYVPHQSPHYHSASISKPIKNYDEKKPRNLFSLLQLATASMGKYFAGV
jgi:hypothetical protein